MSIYENANFIQFPDGGIPSGLVPVKPEDNASNFDFARNSNASRVNKDKLIDEKSADEIRFDYTFASCPDILTEPQSTNLITYSEEFNNSSWAKNSSGTGVAPIVTANQGLSPDGTFNADRLQFNCIDNSSAGNRSLIFPNSVSITSGLSYTFSFYLKANNPSQVGLQLLVLKVISAQITSSEIITIPSEWTRFDFSVTSSSTSTNFIIETRGTFTTNTTADVLIWGAQIEELPYPTSYIKTEGSTETREADEVSNGGQSQDFDSQIGQIMFQGKSHGNDGGEKYFSISDGSAANELLIGYGSTQNQLDFGFTQSSSSEYSDSFNVDDETDFNKVAFEYSSGGIKAWINGVLADESFSLTVPGVNTFDTFNFSDGVGSNNYYGWTRKLFYLPNQAESMEELTAFTQDELISTFNLTVL